MILILGDCGKDIRRIHCWIMIIIFFNIEKIKLIQMENTETV